MVDAVLTGALRKSTHQDLYNGVKVVPSFLLKPVLVDKSNYEAALVGSGYYKPEQLK